MNLHAITHSGTDMELLAAYCCVYYGLDFTVDESGDGLRYWVTSTRYGPGNHMNERTAHQHLDRALAWHADGRPTAE